jgi:hypothetical protein
MDDKSRLVLNEAVELYHRETQRLSEATCVLVIGSCTPGKWRAYFFALRFAGTVGLGGAGGT